MKSLFLLFTLLIALTGCHTTTFYAVDDPEVISAVTHAALKLEKDLDLHLHSSFLYTNGYIDRLQLFFYTQDLDNIRAARHLAVDIVESYLKRFNENEILRYQVARYPFSVFDLEVYVHYESYLGQYVDPLYVERMTIKNGMVYYNAFTAYDLNFEIWHHHEEPYYTTKLIVQAENEEKVPYYTGHEHEKPGVHSLIHFTAPASYTSHTPHLR